MRRAMVVLAGGLLMAVAGCQVKTGDSWNHPVVLASDMTPSAIDGQWEGQWESHEFLDNGLIHFTITPVDVSEVPKTLPAVASLPEPGTRRFLAKVTMWHFGRLCPEDFDMVVIATETKNGYVQIRGDRDLGPLGGFCKYDGFVVANKTVMSFVTQEDFGSLVLRRVVNTR